MADVNEQIDQLVKNNKIVLFMKGTRMFPQCGFSARAVDIFKRCGVSFKDVNVLQDPTVRQGIKDYSNWPTIPQVYIDGQFVGGSDILLEMYENGELQQMLGVEDDDGADATPPKLTVSESAAKAFSAALKDIDDGSVLRFDVPPSFQYDLYFGEAKDDDFVVKAGGLELHVPRRDAKRADGTSIDYVDGPDGAGFRIDNPNEPPRVKPLSPSACKAMLDEGKAHLFDMRSEQERSMASIPQGELLTEEAVAKLPKEANIVVYCHHGVKSRMAAQQLIEQGYKNVFNLTGGIDAWSATVDDSVPRY